MFGDTISMSSVFDLIKWQKLAENIMYAELQTMYQQEFYHYQWQEIWKTITLEWSFCKSTLISIFNLGVWCISIKWKTPNIYNVHLLALIVESLALLVENICQYNHWTTKPITVVMLIFHRVVNATNDFCILLCIHHK